MLTTRLRFIEPQLASPVDQPRKSIDHSLMVSCDTRFGGNPCSVPSPDSSTGDYGYVPLLAPGDTYTAYYQISIYAELEGDIKPVPEPALLPLFATGLGLMALLEWRRRRGRDCHPLARCG